VRSRSRGEGIRFCRSAAGGWIGGILRGRRVRTSEVSKREEEGRSVDQHTNLPLLFEASRTFETTCH
jgi:hypothetical protein